MVGDQTSNLDGSPELAEANIGDGYRRSGFVAHTQDTFTRLIEQDCIAVLVGHGFDIQNIVVRQTAHPISRVQRDPGRPWSAWPNGRAEALAV